jgi:hypothetical protein
MCCGFSFGCLGSLDTCEPGGFVGEPECIAPCSSSSDSTGICCIGLGVSGCDTLAGCTMDNRCAGNSTTPPAAGPPSVAAIPSCAQPYGIDAQGNPVYIGSDGTVYDNSGDVVTNLSGISTYGNLGTCGNPVSPSGGGASGSGTGGGGKAGGSGAGSAAQVRTPTQNTCLAKSIANAMSQFGANIARIVSGGTSSSSVQLTPAQRAALLASGNVSQPAITSNTMLMMVLVFGGLGLLLAFGGKK